MIFKLCCSVFSNNSRFSEIMHRAVCGEWWASESQETLYEIRPALTVFHDAEVFAKEICFNLQQPIAAGGYCVCSKHKLPGSSSGSAAPSWRFVASASGSSSIEGPRWQPMALVCRGERGEQSEPYLSLCCYYPYGPCKKMHAAVHCAEDNREFEIRHTWI